MVRLKKSSCWMKTPKGQSREFMTTLRLFSKSVSSNLSRQIWKSLKTHLKFKSQPSIILKSRRISTMECISSSWCTGSRGARSMSECSKTLSQSHYQKLNSYVPKLMKMILKEISLIWATGLRKKSTNTSEKHALEPNSPESHL